MVNKLNYTDIQAVVCDLDGTLLNNKSGVHPDDLAQLEDLGKKGICRIIATGRSWYSFNEVISPDFPIDYLIICAGGGIIDFKTKQILKASKIPANKVQTMASKLRDLKIDYQVRDIIPKDHHYKYELFFEENPDFQRLNKIYKAFTEPVKEISDLGEASRIISIAPGREYVNFFDKFSSEFSIIRATSPTDHQSVWMELYSYGVNKGKALSNLLQQLNIPLELTLGLGNDYNDIHFLDITGRSFMVDNAPEDLKRQYENTINHNHAPLKHALLQCGVSL